MRRQTFPPPEHIFHFEEGSLCSSPSFSICFGTSLTKPSATFFADFGLNESLTPVHAGDGLRRLRQQVERKALAVGFEEQAIAECFAARI